MFLTIFLWASNLSAQESTMFSKTDASALFSMPLAAWKNNLVMGRDAKIIDYDTDGALEYTMIMKTPGGKLLVTPSYLNDADEPWKLSVAIVYNEIAKQMYFNASDNELRELIAQINLEMRPEYSVFSKFLFIEKNEIQETQIFESGLDATMDKLAEQYKGCAPECIVGQRIQSQEQQEKEFSGDPETSYFDKKNSVVVCAQPLSPFTLGENSLPTDEQVQNLCSSCIWNSFPVDGWQRRIAKIFKNGGDPGWRGKAFIHGFGNALEQCGGYGL